MKSNNAASPFAAAVISAILLFAAAVFSSSIAAPNTPYKNSRTELNTATRLLDTWSGQTDLLDQAHDILARVIKNDPQNVFALKELARYEVMAGYINSRYAMFKSNMYSVGNFEPGTLERAEANIRTALRINPRFAEGYVYLGYIQFQQAKLDDAESSLRRAEQLGTNDPWLDLNWADILHAKGEYAAARQHWEKVLRGNVSNPKAKLAAYGYLIESFKRSGEHEKAITHYRQEIKEYPTNAWIRGDFAAYLSEVLGRNDEAIKQARAALKVMHYGVGERTLAMALYRKWADMVAQGNDAEKYFSEAQGIRPELNEVMAYGASLPGGDRLANALVKKKGVSIDSRADDGSTALLIATNRNSADVVRFLLSLKANPNVPDHSGWTPLLSAADEGNAEIARMLLARGADIKATLGGMDAVTLAKRKGYTKLAAELRKRATGSKEP